MRTSSPESLAAYARIEPTKQETRARIMQYAERCGLRGLIPDEVAADFGCDHNHVAPRITELKASGLLVETHRTRLTRADSPARVLVAKQFAKPSAAQPRSVEASPTATESLFGDLAPERHRDDG